MCGSASMEVVLERSVSKISRVWMPEPPRRSPAAATTRFPITLTSWYGVPLKRVSRSLMVSGVPYGRVRSR